MNPSKALVIFSGGQDSTTCLFWALKKFKHVEAITFDYGQRHRIELECARKLCERFGVEQKVVAMDFLSSLAPSALTQSSGELKVDGGFNNLPSTFVPGRNILFLTLAAAFAAPRDIRDLVVGVCETDFSGYPDCREDFVASMENSLSQGLGVALQIHRPLMRLSKAETFQLASDLGHLNDVVEGSHTCYEGQRNTLHSWGYGCGMCPACVLRKKGFEEFSRSLM